MKGQKAYASAMVVHKLLYNESYNSEEKKVLYSQYRELIKKAAYLGYTEALYDMGQQFEDFSFQGMPNPDYDPKKCIYWYTKACDKNHPAAFNNLATFYEGGIGCEKDLQMALNLYKRSAELGYTLGKKNYKIMLKDMAKGGRHNK